MSSIDRRGGRRRAGPWRSLLERAGRWLGLDPHPIVSPALRRALDDPRTRYRIVDAVLARAGGRIPGHRRGFEMTRRHIYGEDADSYRMTNELVPGVFVEPGEFVAIVDEAGEVVHWDVAEWRDDPEAVTAAIAACILAAARGPAAARANIEGCGVALRALIEETAARVRPAGPSPGPPPADSGRDDADTRALGLRRVGEDFAAVAGRVVRIRSAKVGDGSDHDDRAFDPPIRVRVLKHGLTIDAEVDRRDGRVLLDPLYLAEPVDMADVGPGLHICWIYGRSYYEDGETESRGSVIEEDYARPPA